MLKIINNNYNLYVPSASEYYADTVIDKLNESVIDLEDIIKTANRGWFDIEGLNNDYLIYRIIKR